MFKNKILSIVKTIYGSTNSKGIFTTGIKNRDVVNRKEMLKSLPVADEGTVGEKAVDLDSVFHKTNDIFPNINTPNKLFNGVPFKDLSIFNIRVSPNNTIITLTNSKGEVSLLRSCGVEGFKNTRKGTNVAAQATAITIGTQALENGIKTVRVRVRGLGPGRLVNMLKNFCVE